MTIKNPIKSIISEGVSRINWRVLQTIAMDNLSNKIGKNVRIASGTVHQVKFNQEVELVHIFIETSTELMNTLYSPKDVENFITSDTKKSSPKSSAITKLTSVD
jgi:hypothetical protein